MSRLKFNLDIPVIPRENDLTKLDIRYVVIEPYVSIHIYWNPTLEEVIYEVEEPLLNEDEKAVLRKLEDSIQEMINISLIVEKGREGQEEYLEKIMKVVISELGLNVTQASYEKLFYYVYRDFMGLNEIEPLMNDYFIEDIECNGVGQPLYIVHRIFRNLRTNIQYNDMDLIASFVEKIAQKTGRYVSYASPLLDGTLPDGSRVNATYTKDVSSKGPTFTIRKFTKTPWTPVQLMNFGTVSPEMLAYLWLLLENKLNVLISGGTASGKTTLLNAIAFFIPPEARVVSIEDTRELNLPRENWLPSVVRTGVNLGGVGDVDMFSLLKSSFRQNPDYVIVGEVRGKEASVLFQGMASGHASIGTIHADSVEKVIRRLETPPINLSPTLVNELDAVIVMSHALVKGRETRKLREIIEVVKVTSDGSAETNTPFMWDPGQNKFYYKLDSRVFDKIERRSGIPLEKLKEEFALRTKLLYALHQKKIFDMDSLQKIFNEYHKNSSNVLKKFGVQ